jgi:predicted permease
MDALAADVKYGLRLLRKSPAFSLVTIATLALGIGANAAIYSIVDAVLVRPLPFHAPDRLVMVWEDASYVSFPRNTPAPANYFSWKAMNRVFSDMAAVRGAVANLTAGGPPEQILGRRVTANFFAVLGVAPIAGRTFTEEEDRSGAPVAVISYRLWQRRYSGNPHVVGSDILMNGSRRTIIGVMPATFMFRNRDHDFWTPMSFTPAEIAQRDSHYLWVVARLAPGVTVERAREDMNDVAARLAREYPESNARIGSVVVPLKEDLLGDARLQFVVLLAAAGCVLLVACANIAGLLLSRASARRSEMAVRAAVGATSKQLVRQMIVEGMLLALAGGALGLAVAPAAIRLLGTMVPNTVAAPQTSVLDPRLLGFAFALACLTGVLFSLLPALQMARASLNEALHQSGRGAMGGRAFARDSLVVAQIAVALVLLAGAGLLIRTLASLTSIDVGFRSDHLLTLRTTLPVPKYADPTARLGFYDRVIAGVRELPGVENAAYISTLPFLSAGNTTGYRVEGREPARGQDVLFRVGTPDYLKTIGAELIEGRLPDNRDGRESPWIVVINKTFQRLHWPNDTALGRLVRFNAGAPRWRTVIGVVKDVRERGYELEMKPAAYVLYSQLLTAWAPESLVVRTTVDPARVASGVRRVVANVDPEQPVSAVRTMDEILSLDVADRTSQTTLLSAFAGLALLLCCLGLYGMLSYVVSQRTREIGVRLALGASPNGVARLVIGRGLALTAIGLAIGLALAWMTTRAMRSLLVDVSATDPMTFSSTVGLLLLIALVACSLPALRAARVDPIQVLRQE